MLRKDSYPPYPQMISTPLCKSFNWLTHYFQRVPAKVAGRCSKRNLVNKWDEFRLNTVWVKQDEINLDRTKQVGIRWSIFFCCTYRYELQLNLFDIVFSIYSKAESFVYLANWFLSRCLGKPLRSLFTRKIQSSNCKLVHEAKFQNANEMPHIYRSPSTVTLHSTKKT